MPVIDVRLSAALAQVAGRPRLQAEVAPGATVATLIAQLGQDVPALAGRLDQVVVAIGGQHVGQNEPVQPGQEVVLVMPAAGGAQMGL